MLPKKIITNADLPPFNKPVLLFKRSIDGKNWEIAVGALQTIDAKGGNFSCLSSQSFNDMFSNFFGGKQIEFSARWTHWSEIELPKD